MLRALPVFILADVSGSMDGEKIKQLNVSLRNMLTQLRETKAIPGKFKLCVLTFNDTAQVIQPLEEVEKIVLHELRAGGMTAMGAAFAQVAALVEDPNVVDSRSYAPTLVLMSDGAPTDFEGNTAAELAAWQPLLNLKNGPRSGKAQRLALAIGRDADEEVLKEFIGNPQIPLIKANNEQEMMRFFKWVTMSVISRMKSTNPNDVSVLARLPDFDENTI